MTVAGAHVCQESNWPGGSCGICGRKMPAVPVHERDLGQERDWIVEATQAWHIDVAGLVAFAHQRADRGPVRNIERRDFELEIREELADAANYACWRIEQLRRLDPDDGGHQMDRVIRALRAVALAYQEITG